MSGRTRLILIAALASSVIAIGALQLPQQQGQSNKTSYAEIGREVCLGQFAEITA